MSNTDSISIEGTHDQVAELLRAVVVSQTVLFTLGGDEPLDADSKLEKRLSKLSYWRELLEAKLT